MRKILTLTLLFVYGILCAQDLTMSPLHHTFTTTNDAPTTTNVIVSIFNSQLVKSNAFSGQQVTNAINQVGGTNFIAQNSGTGHDTTISNTLSVASYPFVTRIYVAQDGYLPGSYRLISPNFFLNTDFGQSNTAYYSTTTTNWFFTSSTAAVSGTLFYTTNTPAIPANGSSFIIYTNGLPVVVTGSTNLATFTNSSPVAMLSIDIYSNLSVTAGLNLNLGLTAYIDVSGAGTTAENGRYYQSSILYNPGDPEFINSSDPTYICAWDDSSKYIIVHQFGGDLLIDTTSAMTKNPANGFAIAGLNVNGTPPPPNFVFNLNPLGSVTLKPQPNSYPAITGNTNPAELHVNSGGEFDGLLNSKVGIAVNGVLIGSASSFFQQIFVTNGTAIATNYNGLYSQIPNVPIYTNNTTDWILLGVGSYSYNGSQYIIQANQFVTNFTLSAFTNSPSYQSTTFLGGYNPLFGSPSPGLIVSFYTSTSTNAIQKTDITNTVNAVTGVVGTNGSSLNMMFTQSGTNQILAISGNGGLYATFLTGGAANPSTNIVAVQGITDTNRTTGAYTKIIGGDYLGTNISSGAFTHVDTNGNFTVSGIVSANNGIITNSLVVSSQGANTLAYFNGGKAVTSGTLGGTLTLTGGLLSDNGVTTNAQNFSSSHVYYVDCLATNLSGVPNSRISPYHLLDDVTAIAGTNQPDATIELVSPGDYIYTNCIYNSVHGLTPFLTRIVNNESLTAIAFSNQTPNNMAGANLWTNNLTFKDFSYSFLFATNTSLTNYSTHFNIPANAAISNILIEDVDIPNGGGGLDGIFGNSSVNFDIYQINCHWVLPWDTHTIFTSVGTSIFHLYNCTDTVLGYTTTANPNSICRNFVNAGSGTINIDSRNTVWSDFGTNAPNFDESAVASSSILKFIGGSITNSAQAAIKVKTPTFTTFSTIDAVGGIFPSNLVTITSGTRIIQNFNYLDWQGNQYFSGVSYGNGSGITNIPTSSISTNGSSSGQVLTSQNGQTIWTNSTGIVSLVGTNTTVPSIQGTIGYVPTNFPSASTVTNLSPIIITNSGAINFLTTINIGTVSTTTYTNNLVNWQTNLESRSELSFTAQSDGGNGFTNREAWFKGFNMPIIQAGVTNVTLVGATTISVLFLHAMPTTNYVPYSAGALSYSSVTTNGFTANMAALTFTGLLPWSAIQFTK